MFYTVLKTHYGNRTTGVFVVKLNALQSAALPFMEKPSSVMFSNGRIAPPGGVRDITPMRGGGTPGSANTAIFRNVQLRTWPNGLPSILT